MHYSSNTEGFPTDLFLKKYTVTGRNKFTKDYIDNIFDFMMMNKLVFVQYGEKVLKQSTDIPLVAVLLLYLPTCNPTHVSCKIPGYVKTTHSLYAFKVL